MTTPNLVNVTQELNTVTVTQETNTVELQDVGAQGATGATGAAGPNTVTTSTTTNITGLIKGNGTTISQAVANTDYATPSIALPTGGTAGQILTKQTATDYDADWAIAPYAYFYFNSSGSQSGNRFNDWDDLFTALGEINGEKLVTFEQNETMPAGAYDMTDVTLGGDRLTLNLKLTLADGVTFTSWARGGVTNGLLVSSASTDYIMEITSGGLIGLVNFAAGISSQTTPFFYVGNGATLVVALSGGGSFANASVGAYGGAAVMEANSTAGFAGISMDGNSPNLANDTLTGNGTILKLIQTVTMDPTQGTTHTGFTGSLVNVVFTNAENLGYDNTSSGMTATNVQDAIDELRTIIAGYHP